MAAGGSRLPIIGEGAYPATGGTGAAGPPTTAIAAATGVHPAIGAGSGRRRLPGRSGGTTPQRRSPGYRRASKSKGEDEYLHAQIDTCMRPYALYLSHRAKLILVGFYAAILSNVSTSDTTFVIVIEN